MIKATDLMVGDYLYYFDQLTDEKFLGKIETIEGDVCILDEIDGGFREEHISDLAPIPLTPEILEKSGFEKQDGKQIYIARKMFPSYSNGHSIHYFPKQNLVTISLIFDDGLNAKQYVMPCSYLHELQHALKICKIDKEITL